MTGTLIIAEAGVNHNGSLDRALALVDAAADAGADIVKFQTFRADALAASSAPKAAYQKRETGAGETQLDMLRRLELDEAAHHALLDRCRARGIRFLSTPFDLGSLDLLLRLDVPILKMGSGELTNAPLLLASARTQRPLILSTGMAGLAEVERALGVVAFGYLTPDAAPTRAAFAATLSLPEAWDVLRQRVSLLHCTTEYPTPYDQVNLRALDTLAAAFGLPVGYSDHTQGLEISLAAVARGATIIEKHFTLDRTLPGPDHKASLEPEELKALAAGIRAIEAALGDGIKTPRACELPNVAVARKSLVAARPIAAGEPYTADTVSIKRPGTGRSPFDYWDVLGQQAPRALDEGELLP